MKEKSQDIARGSNQVISNIQKNAVRNDSAFYMTLSF